PPTPPAWSSPTRRPGRGDCIYIVTMAGMPERGPAAAPPAPDLLLRLIRHAEQRTMRAHDSELSARGRRQAERLAERLALLPLTGLVSSHLRPAVETAAAVSRATGVDAEVEPELEEIRIDTEARRRRYADLSSPASALEPDPDDYTSAAMAMVRLGSRTRW